MHEAASWLGFFLPCSSQGLPRETILPQIVSHPRSLGSSKTYNEHQNILNYNRERREH